MNHGHKGPFFGGGGVCVLVNLRDTGKMEAKQKREKLKRPHASLGGSATRKGKKSSRCDGEGKVMGSSPSFVGFVLLFCFFPASPSHASRRVVYV